MPWHLPLLRPELKSKGSDRLVLYHQQDEIIEYQAASLHKILSSRKAEGSTTNSEGDASAGDANANADADADSSGGEEIWLEIGGRRGTSSSEGEVVEGENPQPTGGSPHNSSVLSLDPECYLKVVEVLQKWMNKRRRAEASKQD